MRGEMNRPEFGTQIKATGFARKKPGHDKTRWEEVDCSLTGMYIGYRFVRDGIQLYEYFGDGKILSGFEITAQHEAWLIVTDERTNPIYVFPHQVIDENETAISFREAWKDVVEGNTHDISTLWDGIDDESDGA